MTTTTPPPVTAGFPGMRVTQARAIRSEWTKFRSLRSTSITLAVAIALTVGIGALISAVTAARYGDMPPARKAHFNAIITSLNGVRISQLAVGVLGVLLITGEYATGMIHSSVTVIPKRLPMLWAKMAVFAGIVGITSIASTIAAFYLGQALLAGKHLNASITDPGAARMVIGAGIYLLLIGLIGMGLGTLLRNTAGGISALVALFFVIPRSWTCSRPAGRTPSAPTSRPPPAKPSGETPIPRTSCPGQDSPYSAAGQHSSSPSPPHASNSTTHKPRSTDARSNRGSTVDLRAAVRGKQQTPHPTCP